MARSAARLAAGGYEAAVDALVAGTGDAADPAGDASRFRHSPSPALGAVAAGSPAGRPRRLGADASHVLGGRYASIDLF